MLVVVTERLIVDGSIGRGFLSLSAAVVEGLLLMKEGRHGIGSG